MQEHYIVGLALVFILGFVARWLAWRLNLPSILLLLTFGLAAGPGLGWLDPDALFGNLLFPFVSLSVALILFEGGLSLNFRELPEIGGVVRNLISIGALVTWVVAAFGAWLIVRLPLPLAVLMGAVFVVTGPTVVIPLLRHVRPSPRIRNAIKWEGILNDPVGAILAVLVFEAIVAGDYSGGEHAPRQFLYSILTGGAVGVGGASIIIVLLRFHWVPDMLDNAFSIAMVVGAFVVSNDLQPESGLLATTMMGVTLANQRQVAVQHIVEFKENLRVLIISTLFILLAARLSAEELFAAGLPSLAYLLLLLFVARPLSVWVSCLGSKLTGAERIFLAWMAPRGIVAAAVSSIFAERLAEQGVAGAERLVPISFIIIIGTVTVYGLTAFPLAKKLGLAEPSPQGVLFVGAHPWAREIAKVLHKQGISVALADSLRAHVTAARMDGLQAYFGSILSRHVLDNVSLYGIGKLCALTPNTEANSLAAVHFTEVFGRKDVYQLAPDKDSPRGAIDPQHLQGRRLFSPTATYEKISELFRQGAEVRATSITDRYSYEDFREEHGDEAMPLFVISKKDDEKRLQVVVAGQTIKPRAGQTLISITPPEPPPAKPVETAKTKTTGPDAHPAG